MFLEALVDDNTELLLIAEEVHLQRIWILFSIYKAHILRKSLVEDESAYGRLYQLARVSRERTSSNLDLSVDTNRVVLVSHEHLIDVCKALAITLLVLQITILRTLVCEVVASEYHILSRDCDR